MEMKKEARMPLKDLRKYLMERGYSASYAVYKGIYEPVPEAVYVWGESYEEAARLAESMGYRVEKEKSFDRYMIT